MLRLSSFTAASALVVAASITPTFAGEAISTDRPDFVESSDVVGPGRFQIEAGLAFERTREDGLRLRGRTTPTLLRFGSSQNTELRLETEGLGRVRSQDEASGASTTASGMSDVSIGVKWHLQEGDESGRPGLAALVHVDLPTGARAFRGHGARPSLRGVAEWDLPNEASVGVMAGVAIESRDDGVRYPAGILAVTAGKSWTARWRTFLELAGQSLSASRNGGTIVTADTGATYLVTDDLQLDVWLSRGLGARAPDLQFGTGVSIRF